MPTTTTVATAAQDQDALDAIATMLGTRAEWSSGADMLEDIANVIGTVRPHPGDSDTTYRREFWEATGRAVDAGWDSSEEWIEEDNAPLLAELEAEYERAENPSARMAADIASLRALRDNRAGEPGQAPGIEQHTPRAGMRVVDGVVLYERCFSCHLFIADNHPEDERATTYIHVHRGSALDEALDATHEAQPSGMLATLTAWRAMGVSAVRARLTE